MRAEDPMTLRAFIYEASAGDDPSATRPSARFTAFKWLLAVRRNRFGMRLPLRRCQAADLILHSPYYLVTCCVPFFEGSSASKSTLWLDFCRVGWSDDGMLKGELQHSKGQESVLCSRQEESTQWLVYGPTPQTKALMLALQVAANLGFDEAAAGLREGIPSEAHTDFKAGPTSSAVRGVGACASDVSFDRPPTYVHQRLMVRTVDTCLFSTVFILALM